MPGSSKIVKVAYIVAFVTAALAIITALLTGPMLLMVSGLVPLAAAVGIMRGRVWSAYGYALFLGTALLLVPVVLSRSGAGALSPAEIIGTVALYVVLIPLYFSAGRSLKSAASTRGLASPWIVLSALSILAVFLVQSFFIRSGAMEDTLLIGDRILVQRWPKPNLARDEIVVFLYPVDRREVYVKRVIGLPGDRIRISNKTVYRNSVALQEPYTVHKANYTDPYRDRFPSAPSGFVKAPGLEMIEKHVVQGEVVVPGKSYFVLGDNRDYSLDSREFGFITADDVIGRPLLIYDSREQSTEEVVAEDPRWVNQCGGTDC